jgi:type IV secretory pathway protease TraF
MRLPQGRIVVSFVAVMALALAGIALAQSDPAVGTWKLNTAKSKYDPGPMPKSNTITITAVPNGVHVVARGEDAKGQPTGIDYTATFDGKDAPVKGAPGYDTTSLKRVDANTTEQIRKKDGKMVQTVTRKVSADGKTMTVTTRGKDENGRALNTVAVYDKQ